MLPVSSLRNDQWEAPSQTHKERRIKRIRFKPEEILTESVAWPQVKPVPQFPLEEWKLSVEIFLLI